MNKIIHTTVTALLILCGHTYAGPLDTLERALMPGRLISPHAKYEHECEKCHKSFDKPAQTRLCRDCHKKISKDIDRNVGLHGRSKQIRDKACRDCHTDHIGRNANVILLDRDTFDHNLTDFPLIGRHAERDCKLCHKKRKNNKGRKGRFRGTPNQCVECHKDDEPHGGRLGKVCNICHRESEWRDFIFDHDRTEFPLVGKHRGTQCADCHPNEHYKNIPTKCAACHKRDDRHEGRYGQKCKNCHSPINWFKLVFNHDKDTKFKLRFSHTKLNCGNCHKGKNIYKENLKTSCVSCHKFDDIHRGRNGVKCNNCHTERSFKKAKFDHDKTDFPLKGKHKKIACKDCHRGKLDEEMATDCYSCHRQSDPHKGQQGKKCQNCHNELGWHKKVKFDHALTKFPLLGVHASLACESCHLTASYKDANPNCVSCHKEDDKHKKTLGPVCQTCHNASDWKAWVFDHDKQTDFKLTGAHKGIVCSACHRKPVEKKIELLATCHNCHSVDDIHEGNYGRFCDRCHTTKKFSELKKSLTN